MLPRTALIAFLVSSFSLFLHLPYLCVHAVIRSESHQLSRHLSETTHQKQEQSIRAARGQGYLPEPVASYLIRENQVCE